MVKKILIAYFLVVFLGLVVAGYFISTFVQDQITDSITSRLRIALELLQPVFRGTTEPSEELDRLVRAYGIKAECRVTLIGADGTVLGDSEENAGVMDNHNSRPEVSLARQLGMGENIRFSNTLKRDMKYVAAPLDPGKRDGAIIRLAVPLEDVRDEWYALYQTVAAVLISVGLVIGLVGAVSIRREMRPLRSIMHAAQAATLGDFNNRPAEGTGEMGQLAKAFNQMTLELSQRLEAVSQQKSKLETVITSMQEGVLALDAVNRVQHCNEAAAHFLGLPQPAEGVPYNEVIHNKKLLTAVNKVRKKDKTRHYQIEIHSRMLEVGVTALGQNGEILLIIRDVTEAIKYESLRREFVGNVSHELRTPLSIARGYVETLQSGALESPETARNFLGKVDKNLQQLTNLVDDLLVLSKLESQTEDALISEMELKPLVAQVALDLESLFAKKHQNLVLDIADDLPNIQADPILIERALKNLIANANKYTPDGGTVTVAVHARKKKMTVAVTDTGMGIPHDQIPRVFERFFRVDKSRSREMGGTGLGLSIVKHIAQLHHGTIAVESELEKGSTFTLKLPLWINH